jgi:hypothetical protein
MFIRFQMPAVRALLSAMKAGYGDACHEASLLIAGRKGVSGLPQAAGENRGFRSAGFGMGKREPQVFPAIGNREAAEMNQ